MEFCIFKDYKDIFGKPKEGVHSIRIFNFAVIDVILTILCSFIISKVCSMNFILALIVFFVIGEIIHLIFCVETQFIKMIRSLF